MLGLVGVWLIKLGSVVLGSIKRCCVRVWTNKGVGIRVSGPMVN